MRSDSSLAEYPVIAKQQDFDRQSGSIIERLVFNHRWVVLLFCLLATVIFGVRSTQLQFKGLSAHACLADKGYDADAFLAWLQANGIKAVIPPKANRKEQRECDWWHYKERHLVESMFGKLKYYRRLAMRYEKKALHFIS